MHDLPFNSEILIWQKGNSGQTSIWTELFRLLGIESKTCKVDFSSKLTEFENTAVKPYFVEEIDKNKGIKGAKNDNSEDLSFTTQE